MNDGPENRGIAPVAPVPGVVWAAIQAGQQALNERRAAESEHRTEQANRQQREDEAARAREDRIIEMMRYYLFSFELKKVSPAISQYIYAREELLRAEIQKGTVPGSHQVEVRVPGLYPVVIDLTNNGGMYGEVSRWSVKRFRVCKLGGAARHREGVEAKTIQEALAVARELFLADTPRECNG